MRAVSDAGHLAVLLAGLVQTLVTVDVDQGQLLHSTQTQISLLKGSFKGTCKSLFG